MHSTFLPDNVVDFSHFSRANANPSWEKLHRLSWRLTPLGIMEAQLRAAIKPLGTITLL